MEKKILLVHPSGVIRDVLTAVLRIEGHKVSSVSTASEAINAISLERPALILLELTCPEPVAHIGGVAWDNFLVISWAGRFEAGSAIPFIALGGLNGRKDRDQALEFGAMDFVASPFETQAVVRAVNRAFELASLA